MNLPYSIERISKTMPPVFATSSIIYHYVLYEQVQGILAFLDKPSKIVHLPMSISSEY